MTFDEASELRKSLERERVLFERFEELRRMAAQMRMILSHDIKTPLAVVSGAADLLSADLRRLTEERTTKLLGALVNGVNQIESMVSTGDTQTLTLVKPMVIDLADAARRLSDVEIEGAGEISSCHPAIVDSLLRYILGSASQLRIAPEGDWVVLATPGAEPPDVTITTHLLSMLGGTLEGNQLRLPRSHS